MSKLPTVPGARWELAGNIGVDAGLCWIGDPCYVLHKNKKDLPPTLGKDWLGFCGKIEGAFTSFNYQLGHEGLGVCVSTGYGDGTYPVHVALRDGTVVGAFIDFDPEEDNEDED